MDAELVRRYADEIMRKIHHDMENPLPWGAKVPRDVGSLSCLHDHVDANDYFSELNFLGTHDELSLINRIADEVDQRLAAEAVALDTGKRCNGRTSGR